MLECSCIIVRKLFYSVLLLVDLFGLIKVDLSTGNSISNTEFHFFPRLSGENKKRGSLYTYIYNVYRKKKDMAKRDNSFNLSTFINMADKTNHGTANGVRANVLYKL